MTLWISPTEPPALKALGKTSSIPERFGVDICYPSQHYGMVGVQRKEFRDLVNSLHDGRLGRELAMMQQLSIGVLLVEGNPKWTREGVSLLASGFTVQQFRGMLFSVQAQGYWTLHSAGLPETCESVLQLRSWTEKNKHSLIRTRPNPRSIWGTANSRDWGLHWWQSFPNIGSDLAGRLYDRFGVPVTWTVTEADLMTVEGVGKKRAEKLITALQNGPMSGSPSTNTTAS